jgi:hypothetical protein
MGMWGYNVYPGRCPGLCDCWAFSPSLTILSVLPDSNTSQYTRHLRTSVHRYTTVRHYNFRITCRHAERSPGESGSQLIKSSVWRSSSSSSGQWRICSLASLMHCALIAYGARVSVRRARQLHDFRLRKTVSEEGFHICKSTTLNPNCKIFSENYCCLDSQQIVI